MHVAAHPGRDLRSATAALVDDVLLLDCGPEAPRAPGGRAGRPRRVPHLLLTHDHPDHCDPTFAALAVVGDGHGAPLLVAGPAAAIEACAALVGPDDPVELRVVAAGDRRH